MTSPISGTLCPKNTSAQDLYDSLGGGMATHGIQLGIAAGDPRTYPSLFELANPQALARFALGLENGTNGAFIEPKQAAHLGGDSPPPLGSMSLDGIFQAVRAAEQLQRHGDGSLVPLVGAACDRLLATSAEQLNNKSLTLEHYARDSHGIANVLATVGECARAFPDLVATSRKWSCCARYV